MYSCSDPRVITHINVTKPLDLDLDLNSDSLHKPIMLTFDDGPSRQLPIILNILKKEQVPALFFWQTKLLHPLRPWKRLLTDGHIIGSHSSKHPNFHTLSFDQQYKEIITSVRNIEQITGQRVTYFRPPFGRYNEDTLKILEELKLTPIMWHVTGMDWSLRSKPQKIVENVVQNVQSGSIVLLHELQQTVTILEELIRTLKQLNYRFVITSETIKHRVNSF